jgi:hypothetical protein
VSGIAFKIGDVEMPTSKWRRRLTFAAATGMLLWVPFMILEELLLKAGVLNTKDLSPFIGTENGTAMDYLLNVWHWDGVSFLLFLLAPPSFVMLVILLFLERRATKP